MKKEKMHLIIDSTNSINIVKEQFNALFPFLKLEFFKAPHIAGQGSPKNKMITLDVKIKELQKVMRKGKIDLTSDTVVRHLEQKFKTDFGLYVQVFRKSGSIWLETSATDNWTLQRQNEEGRMLDQHFKIEIDNPQDHDIY